MTVHPENLSELGQLYITLAAARKMSAFDGAGIEESRRDLMELLLDARPKKDGSWRYKNRSEDIDITARVSIEEPLVIVVSVNIRRYR